MAVASFAVGRRSSGGLAPVSNFVGLEGAFACAQHWEYPLTRREQRIRLALLWEKEAGLLEDQLQHTCCSAVDAKGEIAYAALAAEQVTCTAELRRLQEVAAEMLVEADRRADHFRNERDALAASLQEYEVLANTVRAELEDEKELVAVDAPWSSASANFPTILCLRSITAQLDVDGPVDPGQDSGVARDLIRKLKDWQASDEDLAGSCGELSAQLQHLTLSDVRGLAETLVSVMPQLSPSSGTERYWIIIALVELLCESQHFLEVLPVEFMGVLLSELCQKATYCTCMRELDGWKKLLCSADQAGASLLGSIDALSVHGILQTSSLCPHEFGDCPLMADRLAGCTFMPCHCSRVSPSSLGVGHDDVEVETFDDSFSSLAESEAGCSVEGDMLNWETADEE